MHGILYEEPSIWLFLLVTVIMGGWTAWMTGRAVARTWKAYLQVVLYLVILAAAVRFIHFALFQGTLLSLQYYVVDFVVVLIIGSLGFRFHRARQMATQYRWLFERHGPFGWKKRVGTAASARFRGAISAA